jgi:phosphoribosylanthranilate isomerase
VSSLFLTADAALILGTARTLRPDIIVERVRVPVILAGGLGPENVAEAIRTVRPAGVDSKTNTDRDGSHAKDLDRVRQFQAAAKAAMPKRAPPRPESKGRDEGHLE